MRRFSPHTFLVFLLGLNQVGAQEAEQMVAQDYCGNPANTCTFVLLSEAEDRYQVINSLRANTRYTPASTFKIANSLIALDTGTLSGTDIELRVDLDSYPEEDWWQPAWATTTYDLRGAFQNSVYPIYRSIASNIGQSAMSQYLDRFDYGNQDISSGLDSFWVAGSVEISAMEQVGFLQRLHHNRVGLQQSTLDGLREIMLVEETEDYRLFGKTGAALLDSGQVVFWYVGFVEKAEGVHYFAFNMHRPPSPENAQLRIELSRQYLSEFGII